MKRSGGRSPRPAADPWDRVQLRAVAEDLKSVHSRLKIVAASLGKASAGEDRRQAQSRLKLTCKQIWSFAGELVGVQARLQWIGEGLRRANRPIAKSGEEEDLDGSAELLAAIECVLTDRLDPAVAALLEAAGLEVPDGERERRNRAGCT